MNADHSLMADPSAAADRSGRGWHAQIADDKAMLRAARDLTKDIATARSGIYWPDMIGSAVLGYGSLAGAILVNSVPLAIVLGLVAALALYRALLFIHEISHLHRDALPGSEPPGIFWSASRCLRHPSCMKAFTRCITSARNMAQLKIPNICRWR